MDDGFNYSFGYNFGIRHRYENRIGSNAQMKDALISLGAVIGFAGIIGATTTVIVLAIQTGIKLTEMRERNMNNEIDEDFIDSMPSIPTRRKY